MRYFHARACRRSIRTVSPSRSSVSFPRVPLPLVESFKTDPFYYKKEPEGARATLRSRHGLSTRIAVRRKSTSVLAVLHRLPAERNIPFLKQLPPPPGTANSAGCGFSATVLRTHRAS